MPGRRRRLNPTPPVYLRPERMQEVVQLANWVSVRYDTPSHLGKRILVQDQGVSGFQIGGILVCVDKLKPGARISGQNGFLGMACHLTRH